MYQEEVYNTRKDKTTRKSDSLCEDCHNKIDKHYYKRKNENKKNHQRKFQG